MATICTKAKTLDLMPAMDPKQELNALASLSPMFVPAVHSRAAAAPVMILVF